VKKGIPHFHLFGGRGAASPRGREGGRCLIPQSFLGYISPSLSNFKSVDTNPTMQKYQVIFEEHPAGHPNLHSSVSIECKNFSKLLESLPSDRHAYKLKCFTNPLAVGRLPIAAKNFYKYTRYTNHFQSQKLVEMV
jgi:hypothetical protein